MARGISVKVSRVRVIEALTNKLQEMAKAKEVYEQAHDQFEIDYLNWKNEIAQIAYANFDITKADKKSICVRTWGHKSDQITRVEVEVELDKTLVPDEPVRPKDPFESYGYGRNWVGNYNDRVSEIMNAINILKLSDEEVVSTSTYQSVSKYL